MSFRGQKNPRGRTYESGAADIDEEKKPTMRNMTTLYNILSICVMAITIPACSKKCGSGDSQPHTVEEQGDADKDARGTGKGGADNDCPDCKWAIDGLMMTVSLPLDNGIGVPHVGDLQVYAVVDDTGLVSIPIPTDRWSCNRRCQVAFTLDEGVLERGDSRPITLESMSSAEVESLAVDVTMASQVSILTNGSGRPFGLKKVDSI